MANEVYKGMAGMIDEMLDADILIKGVLIALMTIFAQALAETPVQSLVEDVTQWNTKDANRTDDLHLTLTVGDGKNEEAIRYIESGRTDGAIYDILGRKVAQPIQGGVYIQDGKKVVY